MSGTQEKSSSKIEPGAGVAAFRFLALAGFAVLIPAGICSVWRAQSTCSRLHACQPKGARRCRHAEDVCSTCMLTSEVYCLTVFWRNATTVKRPSTCILRNHTGIVMPQHPRQHLLNRACWMPVNIPDYRRQLLACQQSASLNPYAAVTCPSALDAEVKTDLDC